MSGALQASASIHTLPDELLLGIAREAQFGPLRICAVCQRWRRIGHTNRSLWTYIELDDTRADMSRERALYFADLAGSLPLEIFRPGYPLTHAEYDTNRTLSDLLDDFVLALVPRCKSYMCWWMTADAPRVAFIKALFRVRCEHLQTLKLGSHLSIEVTYGDAEALPVFSDMFPSLSTLGLSNVCLPLSRMLASSHCTNVSVHHKCDVDDCQHTYTFGLEIQRIVEAVPALRALMAELCGDFVLDLEEDTTGRFDLYTVLTTLSETLEKLFVLHIPTTWPSLWQLEQLSLVHLRELWLDGPLVQPRTSVQEGDPQSDFIFAIQPFLQLLAAMPNLVKLHVQEWWRLPQAVETISPQTTCLSRLEVLQVEEVCQLYVGQMLSRLKMPGLRHLDLATLFRNEGTAFKLADVMHSWDFPCLEYFGLSSSLEEGNEGDPTFPAFALGQVLRNGNLPRLRRIDVTTRGWVTDTDLRDAIEALRDPSVLPSLVELRISNSTPPVDPSWVEAAVQERNTRMGDDPTLRRLSITVISGDLIDSDDEREVEEDRESEDEENEEVEYTSDGNVETDSIASESA